MNIARAAGVLALVALAGSALTVSLPPDERYLPVERAVIAFGGARETTTILLDDGGVIETDAEKLSAAVGREEEGGSVEGVYGWELIGFDGELARLRVWFSVNATAVLYEGREAAELAESRDFSFVRRVEILSLDSVSARGKTVLLRGLFQLGREEEILLDPSRGVIVDESGEPWGRFLLWIDPEGVPRSGWVTGVAIFNWTDGTEVVWNLSRLELKSPLRRDGLESSEVVIGVANLSLYEPGRVMAVPLLVLYDSETGAFLEAPSGYADDYLRQRLGIVVIRSAPKPGSKEFGLRLVEVKLARTEGSAGEQLYRNLSLAFVVAALAVLSFLLMRRR